MPIVDFAKAKLERSAHSSGKARCLDCKHEWIAVAPVGNKWLECPSCTLTRGRMMFNHQRLEDEWECSCGNDLFLVNRSGVYCPNCGDWQVFPK